MTQQLKLDSQDIKTLSSEPIELISKEIEKEIIEYIKENPIEIDWNYDDELSEDQIKSIFKSDSAEKIQEAIWGIENELIEYNLDYIDTCETTLEDNIKKDIDLSEYKYEDGELNADVEEEITELVTRYSILNMNIDSLMSKSTVNVVATIHSNYDCLSANYYEEMDGGYVYKDSYFKDMLDFLNINPQEFKKKCIERNNSEIGQKYTTPKVQGKFPNYKWRNGKELIDIESLLVELENNSSSSNFIFIVEMAVDDAVELFKKKEKAKYLKVSKGTTCGLFSNWEGGGSTLECKVVNPNLKIKLKRDKHTEIDIEIEPFKHHYTVDDVFGLCRGVLQAGNLDLI